MNNRVCQYCGNPVSGTESICTKCGAALPPVQNTVPQQQPVYNQNPNYGGQYPNMQMNMGARPSFSSRSIVTALLLSLVTCGIYGIYWFVCLTNEANEASGDTNATSGGMAFLLTLVTCGIYSIYWAYKMGERMAQAGQRYGKPIENRSVLYLILSIIGFGIINYALIQDDLNKLVG